MLKPQPFANAAAVVSLGLYVVCRVVSFVAPDLVFSIGSSWYHTINMDSMRSNMPLDMGTFIIGAASVIVVVWVTAYAFASLYNKLVK